MKTIKEYKKPTPIEIKVAKYITTLGDRGNDYIYAYKHSQGHVRDFLAKKIKDGYEYTAFLSRPELEKYIFGESKNNIKISEFRKLIREEVTKQLSEAKKLTASDMVKMFANAADWGPDAKDQTYVQNGKLVYIDSWYYGQERAMDNLVKSWKPGGHNYKYWNEEYGVKPTIVDQFSEIKATGRHKKLTKDGIVGVVLNIK
ncbi:MAG: hypothetical protein H8E98_04720 [Bacteroidetes bacterium]|nr:hypothetical protein [Bacteroidota bacterium]